MSPQPDIILHWELCFPLASKSIQTFAQSGEEGKPMAIPDLNHEFLSLSNVVEHKEFSGVRWRSLFGEKNS